MHTFRPALHFAEIMHRFPDDRDCISGYPMTMPGKFRSAVMISGPPDYMAMNKS